MAEKPRNNLAILKLRNPMPNGVHTIQLCLKVPELGTPLASLGFGSTSTISYEPSLEYLKEAYFYESVFTTDAHSTSFFETCPESDICTDTLTAGTSICSGDIGGPLYEFNCGTIDPVCLYGVASYFTQNPDNHRICNDASVFTKLTHFHDWIKRICVQFNWSLTEKNFYWDFCLM